MQLENHIIKMNNKRENNHNVSNGRKYHVPKQYALNFPVFAFVCTEAI